MRLHLLTAKQKWYEEIVLRFHFQSSEAGEVHTDSSLATGHWSDGAAFISAGLVSNMLLQMHRPELLVLYQVKIGDIA
jgi:hypothetical protein